LLKIAVFSIWYCWTRNWIYELKSEEKWTNSIF